MTTDKTHVSIRQYRNDDKTAVASLYAAVFGERARSTFMRRWNWQFHANPAAQFLESLMWVAEMRGNIVGFLASFPTRFKFFEKETTIRLPCDLMVSSEARGKSTGENLIRAYLASEDLLVNALAYSPAAGRIYQRLGYQAVNAEQLALRPYDIKQVLSNALTRRARWRSSHLWLSPVVFVAGGFLNLGFRTINRAKKPRLSNEFDIRQSTTADASFDALWQRISAAFPISAVRDRLWVNWRFFEDPCFEHTLYCSFDKNGDLSGYVDTHVSTKSGTRYGRIIDLFCDPGEPALAESLLSAAIQHLQEKGVDVITCLGHLPSLRQVIAKYCYLKPKRLQEPALIVWKGDPAMKDAVYDPSQWHLTHADGDDSFSP